MVPDLFEILVSQRLNIPRTLVKPSKMIEPKTTINNTVFQLPTLTCAISLFKLVYVGLSIPKRVTQIS